MSDDSLINYGELFVQIKSEIRSAQFRVLSSANRELLLLYWNIGRVIVERGEWGSDFIGRLSKDLRSEFPDIKGFSVRNLKYMRKFAEVFPFAEKVQTLSAQLSWSHVTLLLDRVKKEVVRDWYVEQCCKNCWSVRVLDNQIATDLFSRQAESCKISNFDRVLPEVQALSVISSMKNPYVFDLMGFSPEMDEREIEGVLVGNVTRMLLELGSGFSFVGRQFHLEVGGEDFYIDLLFYHLKLHCYVVVDLKTGKFTPEQAGKMNFYLSAVDDVVKSAEDKPSIGLILCRDGNSVVAEYALRDMSKPIGVSEYKFMSELPEELRTDLPDAYDFSEKVVREMNIKYIKDKT